MHSVNSIFDKIIDWENRVQEDFTDNYMHDCIDWEQWTEFLIKNGYEERAAHIKYQMDKGNSCIDQQLLFNVNLCEAIPEEDDAEEAVSYSRERDKWHELYEKDVTLWAKYIVETPQELFDFLEWIDKYFKGD